MPHTETWCLNGAHPPLDCSAPGRALWQTQERAGGDRGQRREQGPGWKAQRASRRRILTGTGRTGRTELSINVLLALCSRPGTCDRAAMNDGAGCALPEGAQPRGRDWGGWNPARAPGRGLPRGRDTFPSDPLKGDSCGLSHRHRSLSCTGRELAPRANSHKGTSVRHLSSAHALPRASRRQRPCSSTALCSAAPTAQAAFLLVGAALQACVPGVCPRAPVCPSARGHRAGAGHRPLLRLAFAISTPGATPPSLAALPDDPHRATLPLRAP